MSTTTMHGLLLHWHLSCTLLPVLPLQHDQKCIWFAVALAPACSIMMIKNLPQSGARARTRGPRRLFLASLGSPLGSPCSPVMMMIGSRLLALAGVCFVRLYRFDADIAGCRACGCTSGAVCLLACLLSWILALLCCALRLAL